MKPINTEDKGNYRIETLSEAFFRARGKGLSGSILFTRGREGECAFLKKATKYDEPKEVLSEGIVLGNIRSSYSRIVQETGKPALHLGEANGKIHVCPEKDCCRGIIQNAVAHAPASVIFSQISSGSKSSGYFSPKDENGDISLPALYLALITMGEEYSPFCTELIAAINMHPKQFIPFVDNYGKASSFHESAYAQFRQFAGEWLFEWVEREGSKAMREATNLLTKIEKNIRNLTKSESDFLDAVSQSASKIFDVPKQKEVMRIWLNGQSGRNEKQFRDTRDRLGFNWLPTAIRGKNSH